MGGLGGPGGPRGSGGPGGPNNKKLLLPLWSKQKFFFPILNWEVRKAREVQEDMKYYKIVVVTLVIAEKLASAGKFLMR